MANRIKINKKPHSNIYMKGYHTGVEEAEVRMNAVHQRAMDKLQKTISNTKPYDLGFRKGQAAGIEESGRYYINEVDYHKDHIESLQYTVEDMEEELNTCYKEYQKVYLYAKARGFKLSENTDKIREYLCEQD